MVIIFHSPGHTYLLLCVIVLLFFFGEFPFCHSFSLNSNKFPNSDEFYFKIRNERDILQQPKRSSKYFQNFFQIEKNAIPFKNLQKSYALPKGTIHPKKEDAFRLLTGKENTKKSSKKDKVFRTKDKDLHIEIETVKENRLNQGGKMLEIDCEEEIQEIDGEEISTLTDNLGKSAVILVRPYLDENIGSVARGMLNFGLTDLRLVNPFCNHTSVNARARSSGADAVLEEATVYDTIEDAVSDLTHVFATSARLRDRTIRIDTPDQAVEQALHLITQHNEKSQQTRNNNYNRINSSEVDNDRQNDLVQASDYEIMNVGFMFGSERNGLSNEELTYANSLVVIPAHPNFSSLNLAMAVNIIGYEFWSQLCKYLETQRQIAYLKLKESNNGKQSVAFGEGEKEEESIVTSRPSTIQKNIFKLPPSKSIVKSSRLAKKSEITTLMDRLVKLLDQIEYQTDPNRKKYIVERITSIFNRAEVDLKDVDTFHGIISSIYHGHHRLPVNQYYFQKDHERQIKYNAEEI